MSALVCISDLYRLKSASSPTIGVVASACLLDGFTRRGGAVKALELARCAAGHPGHDLDSGSDGARRVVGCDGAFWKVYP
jgi:hypothetical protein